MNIRSTNTKRLKGPQQQLTAISFSQTKMTSEGRDSQAISATGQHAQGQCLKVHYTQN